jgi:2-amino-4-hydroxy-6-hydroxymethyldihydropteridine diphosphokinase
MSQVDGFPAGCNALIGLGSNVGDKTGNIAQAIELLTAREEVRLVARSRLYRTPPWGKTDQDWFVNACIGIATALSPRELLGRCQAVENELGRVRRERWGPRVIDVDVLAYRDVVLDEPNLVVPHPRIAERAFVLVPLADIAPDLVIDGRTVTEHLGEIDRAGVEVIGST